MGGLEQVFGVVAGNFAGRGALCGGVGDWYARGFIARKLVKQLRIGSCAQEAFPGLLQASVATFSNKAPKESPESIQKARNDSRPPCFRPVKRGLVDVVCRGKGVHAVPGLEPSFLEDVCHFFHQYSSMDDGHFAASQALRQLVMCGNGAAEARQLVLASLFRALFPRRACLMTTSLSHRREEQRFGLLFQRR